MPSDHSAPQRAAAWPEVPPAWPEVPATSSPFTPTVRSFVDAAPPQPAPPIRPQPGPSAPVWEPMPPRADARPAPQAPVQPPMPPRADDPYKPFVTAGQISGPKTPPAHRQQELWNTVFGENYRAIDEYEEDDEGGRPIWLFALVGSVLVALVGVLVWAFVAGPLSSGDDAGNVSTPTAKPSNSVAAAKPQSQFPGLPKYKGTPSPVSGLVTDLSAGITVPRLGGPWRVDTQDVQATYGFATRQYVSAGMTTRGKPEFAQVMSGPLPQSLAARYTTPDKLTPVVSAVMFQARQSLFPKGNKATKVAQQRLSRGGLTGLLAVYKISADHEDTTVVVAALNTGGDLPAVVYMAVPALKDDLLPDINTVFKSIRQAA